MRLWSGQSGRTGRDETHDSRSRDPVLQGAGNIDGRQALHRGHRRVERRLYIRRASHPADTVPRPRHGSTSKLRPNPAPRHGEEKAGLWGNPFRCRNTIYYARIYVCTSTLYIIYVHRHRVSEFTVVHDVYYNIIIIITVLWTTVYVRSRIRVRAQLHE